MGIQKYDFSTKTGVVYEGVTAIDLWFLGGEKIQLNPDRSVSLYNAFVTTSESKNADWKIQSREVEISNKNLLAAKNVTFRFFRFLWKWEQSNIPNLWLAITFFKSLIFKNVSKCVRCVTMCQMCQKQMTMCLNVSNVIASLLRDSPKWLKSSQKTFERHWMIVLLT